MSLFEVLRLAGIASCAAGVLLLALAVHAFVANDVLMVLDDLSGRRRMRTMDELAQVRHRVPAGEKGSEGNANAQGIQGLASEASAEIGVVMEPAQSKTAMIVRHDVAQTVAREPFFFDVIAHVVLCACVQTDEAEVMCA